MDTQRYATTVSLPGLPTLTLAFAVLSLLSSLLLGLGSASPARACKGHPPPTFCGKSLVLSQAAPPVLLLPGGGTFDVPVTVFFKLVSFPAGSGICPSGPYIADVDLTVTCSPSADGAGALSGIPLSAGYNDLSVPVTLPAGPPRLCEVDGIATLLLADGMELTATSDSLVCIGDPAPQDPTLPRLDMILLQGPGAEIQKAHPGDQTAFTYRITNNDPLRSYTGELAVESVNSSRLPGMSGPMPPGTGVYPISDPGLGDNFPIRFPQGLVNGCVPLPLDPSLPIVPTLMEPLLIPPLDFIDVEVHARSWGMCADGSCSRGKLLLDGEFSDATAGVACSGFVHAADTSVAPLYLWPDSGQVALFPPPPNPLLGALTFTGEPLLGQPVEIDGQLGPPQLLTGGIPVPLPPQLLAGTFDPELGRIEARWQNPDGVFPPEDPFEINLHLELAPNPSSEVEIELVALNLMGGAPTGFEDVSPFSMGQVAIQFPPQTDGEGSHLEDSDIAGPEGPGPDGAGPEAFLEMTFQVSGQATDETGARRDLVFASVDFVPSGGGTGIDVHLTGVVAPGPGAELESIQVYSDLTGFLSEALTPFLFADGFEGGTTAAWSLTVP